ncbi:hypothetical protein ACHAWF_015185 [Thalassiosira exigua]
MMQKFVTGSAPRPPAPQLAFSDIPRGPVMGGKRRKSQFGQRKRKDSRRFQSYRDRMSSELSAVSVGQQIGFFSDDNVFYYGVVAAHSPTNANLHSYKIAYDDGDVETIDLSSNVFELVPPENEARALNVGAAAYAAVDCAPEAKGSSGGAAYAAVDVSSEAARPFGSGAAAYVAVDVSSEAARPSGSGAATYVAADVVSEAARPSGSGAASFAAVDRASEATRPSVPSAAAYAAVDCASEAACPSVPGAATYAAVDVVSEAARPLAPGAAALVAADRAPEAARPSVPGATTYAAADVASEAARPLAPGAAAFVAANRAPEATRPFAPGAVALVQEFPDPAAEDDSPRHSIGAAHAESAILRSELRSARAEVKRTDERARAVESSARAEVKRADERARAVESSARKRVRAAAEQALQAEKAARVDRKVSRKLAISAEAAAKDEFDKMKRQMNVDIAERDALVARCTANQCAALEAALTQRDASIAEAAAAEQRRIREKQQSQLKLREERRAWATRTDDAVDRERRSCEAKLQSIEARHEKKEVILRREIDRRGAAIQDQRLQAREKVKQIESKIEHQRLLMHNLRAGRRRAIEEELGKRRQLQRHVADLHDWLDEMADEVAEFRRMARAASKEKDKAVRHKSKAEELASNRLALLRELKLKLDETQDDLADESHRREALERLATIQKQIKRERQVGRRGGSSRWPVHVVLLICEMLVNGTPPSATQRNLQSMKKRLNIDDNEPPPSLNFIRECRVVVQNLNECMAAMRLGNVSTWHQMFTDGTSRRQVDFQNLVIGLMEEDELEPVIVSSCMFLETGSSEHQVKLQHWRSVTAREFPDRPDLVELIPDPKEIDACKLGEGGGLSPPTRATLLTKFVVYLEQVIRAFHKEFSLTANYPKGHGELFRLWMMEHHPEEFLMHAERALGSRQDLICMGACPIFWNREYCVEFLAERLAMKDGENILQSNLYTILTSTEMIAVSRFFAIVHLSMFMPFRWLSGQTHKLAKHNWGPRSMGRAMDLLLDACEEILEDTKLIHDRSYMMELYSELADELPEFRDYLSKQFEDSTSHIVETSRTKAVPLSRLLDELFSPCDVDNQESTEMLEKVAAVGIEAMKKELLDETKATHKYLSVSGSEYSFEHCPESVKKDMLGAMATNDLAESSFAGVTSQLQSFGRIAMCSAAAVSDAKRNKFFYRATSKKAIENGEEGLFYTITAVMMSMEDAPATRQSNNNDLERYRKIRWEKEQLAKQQGLEHAKDEYIEALIYRKMWDSDACWKTVGDVTRGLKNVKTQAAKYYALKNNFQIRHKGFGWKHWKPKYSEGGRKFTVQELANALKDLIKGETKQKTAIPEKPNMPLMRKEAATLGQVTNQRRNLEEKSIEDKDNFDREAREEWRDREGEGIGSVHQSMQRVDVPDLHSLVDTRIEYYTKFDLDEKGTETANKWCGGVIKRVSDGTWLLPGARTRCYKRGEAAEVLWDPVEEIGMGSVRSIVHFDPKKWNQDEVNSWRKDYGDIDYGL